MRNQGRTHLFAFNADGGAGDGGSDAGTGGDGGAGDAGDQTPSFQPITSQEQFDRMVQQRIARVKSIPPADYEDLKAKASKFDELDAASKSELEKANERAERAEKERLDAIETANKRLIAAEILAEASAQKALKPEHMHRLIDTGEVTVGDDGQVTGVKEAVEAFLKANPEYVGRPSGSADQGAREHGGVKQVTEAELKTMKPEAIDQAHREGRLATVLGAR
jgi:hypothetical protein